MTLNVIEFMINGRRYNDAIDDIEFVIIILLFCNQYIESDYHYLLYIDNIISLNSIIIQFGANKYSVPFIDDYNFIHLFIFVCFCIE